MKYTSAVLASFVTGVTAFTQHSKLAFSPRLQKHSAGTAAHVPATKKSTSGCSGACSCPACANAKKTSCNCPACRGGSTALLSTPTVEDTTDDAAPPEVEAMDGIESPEEAHNAERPARKSIAKKKTTPGKPLSEFEVGQTVTGKVRSIMAYGAFMDFGAESDGLLHISALSTDFVDDVKSVLDMGAEYEVRIISIDLENKKVGLSKLSTDQEAEQQEAKGPRQQNRGGNRGKEQQMVAQLASSTWDETKFISGEVVNTADFGAFVRFDIHDLVETVDAGSMVDGLVHISCLAEGRVSSVTDVAKKGDKVQIRLKTVQNKKISLSMVSAEAEETKMESRGGGGGGVSEYEGNKNWKEAVEALEEGMSMSEMSNIPLVKRG